VLGRRIEKRFRKNEDGGGIVEFGVPEASSYHWSEMEKQLGRQSGTDFS
jgi:hypothetical protein